MLDALHRLQISKPGLRASLVLPTPALVRQAEAFSLPGSLQVQTGDLAAALSRADVALASTGTVTLECAYFGVPTVAIYKTSWSTYQIGKRLITVRFLAMPNLLAGEEVFPELIQDAATGENLSRAAINLLENLELRRAIRMKLRQVVQSLGGPGASGRAAAAILESTDRAQRPLRTALQQFR
jgi:lipid-A-disaccharide synthase